MSKENATPEYLERKDTVESVPYIVYESAQARHERSSKRTLIALVIAIVMLFASNLVWIWYNYQYDYSSYTVSTDGGGNAYYNEQGENGNIVYGENSSEEANTQEAGN